MNAEIERLLRRLGDGLPPLTGYPLALRRFRPGDAIVACREPLERLDFLVEGRASVFTAAADGRMALHTEYDGVQAIGDMELLMDGTLLETDVRALSACAVLSVPLEGQRERLLGDPAMLRFLGREVARKLERSSRQRTQNQLYPLSTRLAAYLLSADGALPEPLSRLSERMGVSYRHLLRTLSDFCARGWLARDADGYRVRDAAALREASQPMRDE